MENNKNDNLEQARISPSVAGYPYVDEKIDLKEFFVVLWEGKRLIGSLMGVAAVVAFSISLMIPNTYISSALLAPAENAGGVNSLIKQYGGLASLAGIPLPGGADSSKSGLAKQLLRSRAFLWDFIERRDILPHLMAVDEWNPTSEELVLDSSVYDVEEGKWIREVDPPMRPRPSMQEAHEEFLKILRVSEDSETRFITVSIEHQSPVIAQQWVEWLVDDINTAVKNQDVTEAERSIQYLTEQIEKTALAELQTMFFELIQSQTETIMLAQVRPEYVFKTIDPAVVPEEKSSPNRALFAFGGLIFGGTLGLLIVVVRYYGFGQGHPN